MRLFFYGTLMDPDICRLVLGEQAQRMRSCPAALPGYRRVRGRKGNFPVLVRRTGGRVHGQLVEGLDATALASIAHFEGREYEPESRLVIDQTGRRQAAWLFLPNTRAMATVRNWSLVHWQQRSKPRLVPQLRRWLLEYGADRLQSPDVSWHVRRTVQHIAAAQAHPGAVGIADPPDWR